MLTIHFIRHAQSESNAGMRTEHPATIRLTEKGHQQAKLTALAFQHTPDLIVTSPYLRTRLTAEPLIKRFPETPCVEWPVQEFTYLDPAHWNGTTWQERQPAAQLYWERLDPGYRDGEGAETWLELIARIETTRQLILDQEVETIVVFSHGLFTRSLWWRLSMPELPLNLESMRRYAQFTRGISFPNCASFKFRFDQDEFWCSRVELKQLPPELVTH